MTIRQWLFEQGRRHVNTTSDSEVLLKSVGSRNSCIRKLSTDSKWMFLNAIKKVHTIVKGAYAVAAMIIGHGMVAFRDPNGIRPLCLGKRELAGRTEYMVASESVALDAVGFDFVRDVAPGEAIYATFDGSIVQ